MIFGFREHHHRIQRQISHRIHPQCHVKLFNSSSMSRKIFKMAYLSPKIWKRSFAKKRKSGENNPKFWFSVAENQNTSNPPGQQRIHHKISDKNHPFQTLGTPWNPSRLLKTPKTVNFYFDREFNIVTQSFFTAEGSKFVRTSLHRLPTSPENFMQNNSREPKL